ncbi:MAG: hypothetical protein JWP63_870 [Candidatus Solibacter sp.]|nr:hypothetical protein [Candidatus Solibacter sp.]
MTTYHGRRAAAIENDHLRVTVLQEGGHIAEILDKETGVNPLWLPPWPSIEHSAYGSAHYAEYGAAADGSLLAGIMGHNLCLDIFGGPSAEEAACGLPVHGEGAVVPYTIHAIAESLTQRAELPIAKIAFERRVELHGRAVRIRESVESLAAYDRPIGWTQHVTLGPPFLEKGVTQFRASATRSKVFEGKFGTHDYLRAGAEFDWPDAPGTNDATVDLRVANPAPASSGFTTHLMDPARDGAFFAAYSPASRLAFGYVWKQSDFPWLGIWEENHSRTHVPWSGRTLTRGMEFGVSPMPESRREMIDRCPLFGTPVYRWLPAKARIEVEYWAIMMRTDSVPETLDRPA